MSTAIDLALPAEDLAFYADNGYLLVKGLFSPEEAARFRQEGHDLIDRLSAYDDVEATWDSARGTAGATRTRLLHCHSVEFHSGVFARLIVEPRLTDIAAALLGGPNVQLHHTKLFIKPPENGSPFPMHQDYPFFEHEHHRVLAAIIHFDDAPEEKGCLRVVPGSHKLGPIPHDPEGGFHLPFEQYPLESSVALPAQAGDVLFFTYLTVHGSGVNVSNEARTTLLMQLRDPADRALYGAPREAGEGLMLRGVLPAGADGLKAVKPVR
jgi:ectoine hydroxylase-related dioxygenase (phytanoyl-CoA dioxygenase family)